MRVAVVRVNFFKSQTLLKLFGVLPCGLLRRSSSDYTDLARRLPSSYKTGRWQRDILCQELHEVERRRGWFGF